MLFHIERLLGHRVDDNYPLSLYLRASKEIKNYIQEMKEANNGSSGPKK